MTVSLSSPATDRLKSPQAPLTDPNAQLTKRLYVGGLTPSIASKDLKDRFSMFGTVEEVEEVGVDGLGEPSSLKRGNDGYDRVTDLVMFGM